MENKTGMNIFFQNCIIKRYAMERFSAWMEILEIS